MRPIHCAGGVEAGGSEATAVAASTSKEVTEADTADWS